MSVPVPTSAHRQELARCSAYVHDDANGFGLGMCKTRCFTALSTPLTSSIPPNVHEERRKLQYPCEDCRNSNAGSSIGVRVDASINEAYPSSILGRKRGLRTASP